MSNTSTKTYCILVLPTLAYPISFQACSLAPIHGEFIYRYTGDSFFCNYTYPFSSLVLLPSAWFMAMPPPPSTSVIRQDKAAAGCTRCAFHIFSILMLSNQKELTIIISPMEQSGCNVHTISPGPSKNFLI